MNAKSAIIKGAVQLLAANTNIIRQPEPFEDFFSILFGTETHEQRVARQTEEVVDKTVDAVKKLRTKRQFKKIVQHI